MKITIVYTDKEGKVQRPEFKGNTVVAQAKALQFIFNMQSINIISMRLEE